MPSDTHIVRFKILRVECAAMPEGQQYTIHYRRGDTNRSTPCYVARNGVIDFSTMPEGAAVIHFKSGHAGRRYAPKYIQLRMEEYTRGMPRRVVGECEVDCTDALDESGVAGSEVLTVNVRMYGAPGKVYVGVLVYPESAPAMSFDALMARFQKSTGLSVAAGRAGANGSLTGASAAAAGLLNTNKDEDVKVMTRGEAMTLLISLETMLERQRTEKKIGGGGGSGTETKLERRLRVLEERRRELTGSTGLATKVATTRCVHVVAAQFAVLAKKYRSRFLGETAAYLRHMSMMAGSAAAALEEEQDSDDDDDGENAKEHPNYEKGDVVQRLRSGAVQRSGSRAAERDDGEPAERRAGGAALLRDQLEHSERRIDELMKQLRGLEDAQSSLTQLQRRINVTAESRANTDKMATLQAQIKMLQTSRDSIQAALLASKATSRITNTNTNSSSNNNNNNRNRVAKNSTHVQASGRNAQLTREVNEIKARIAALRSEQAQLHQKIDHMSMVAAGHILTWARSKNGPLTQKTGKSIDDLFDNDNDNDNNEDDDDEEEEDESRRGRARKAVKSLTEFEGLRTRKQTADAESSASSPSPSSSPDSSRHGLFGATDLPSMGDFGDAAPVTQSLGGRRDAQHTVASDRIGRLTSPTRGGVKEKDGKKRKKNTTTNNKGSSRHGKEEANLASASTTTAAHKDPLAPEGLGVDMFASSQSHTNRNKDTRTGLTSSSVLPQRGGPLSSDASGVLAMDTLQFGGPDDDAAGVVMGRGSSERRGAAQDVYGNIFDSNNNNNNNNNNNTKASSAWDEHVRRKTQDDPFYDDIDDFTIPAMTGNSADVNATVEIDDDFAKFGLFRDAGKADGIGGGGGAAVGGGAGVSSFHTSANRGGQMGDEPHAARAKRPTFDFGPGNADPDHGEVVGVGGGGRGGDGAAVDITFDTSDVPFELNAMEVDEGSAAATADKTVRSMGERGGSSAANTFSAYSNMPKYDFGSS